MKKNLIAIAIAAAVAAPLTAQAIDMSGDARVRYYSNDVTNSAADGKGAQTDSRIGLDIKGTDGEVAMAKVRLEVNNAVHDNSPTTDGTIDIDHAYISANVGAGVKVTGGKTIGNWGHKFVIWDAPAERVDIQKSLGDMTFGLTFTKNNEVYMATTDDKGDTSTTSLYFKMGKMGGIRNDNMKNDATGASTKRTAFYGGAPLPGGWGLGFEYATIDADTGSTSFGMDADGGDKATGLMLAGMGKVGGTDVTVGYASAADGYSSDDDFFTFAGTGAQAGTIFAGLESVDNNKMTGLFAVASGIKAGPATMEFGVAMIKSDAAGDPSETVLSIKADMPLSKNTKVLAQYGNFSGDFMDATHMGASIETKF